MAGARIQPKQAFLWQALLILLPLIVLAAFGWFSLRQDRAVAEAEARERAQAIADDLLPRFRNELTSSKTNSSFFFEVDRAGRLTFPPSYDAVPLPRPLALSDLTPRQMQLWLAAQASDRLEPYRAFVDANPPPDFVATAYFEIGIRYLKETNYSQAAEMFHRVATDYPDARGESGLPLRPLAQLKLIEMQPLASSPPFPLKYSVPLDSFCSNIVHDPTPLTSQLFGRIQELLSGLEATANPRGTNTTNRARSLPETVQGWERDWNDHERSRELFAAASAHPAVGSSPLLLAGDPGRLPPGGLTQIVAADSHLFWFATPQPVNLRRSFKSGIHEDEPATMPVPEWVKRNVPGAKIHDQSWLAIRVDKADSAGFRFSCRPESELGFSFARLVQNDKHIPEYFGVGVELGGKRITEYAPDLRLWRHETRGGGGKGGGTFWIKTSLDHVATNLLASAIEPEGGLEQLKVHVYLTSPETLFATQRWRVRWFGLLIALSTAAALTGLIATWQTFLRQQQLGEMKSNFVSSVSHELRAPIASVRLLAESLEHGKVPEPGKQNQYFRFIGQECRRLSSLIENVLDFSRIEQGRKQYEFEPTDVAALTRQTVKLMEPYAEEKGVRLESSNLQPPTSNLELEVDGRAIQQALVNLIDNAIKHSPKGETVMVELQPSAMPDAGCRMPDGAPSDGIRNPESIVRLSVEDHGPGIPPAEHEKIFERFYRRGSELRRETQGVGIGLSIVKHIVEAHGGRVAVRSDVGQGSRFTIELPGLNSELRNPKSE